MIDRPLQRHCRALAAPSTWTRQAGPSTKDRSRGFSGSPACRDRANRPGPTWWKKSCTASAGTPTFSMATALRQGLNRDLGYSAAGPGRTRAPERPRPPGSSPTPACIVLVAVTSPFRSERRAARELFAPRSFVEIFVDTPPGGMRETGAGPVPEGARRGDPQRHRLERL